MATTMTGQAVMQVSRCYWQGSPAVKLSVRNAGYCDGLREMLDELGVVPVADVANLRSIVCTTPEQLDAVRDRLKPYCDPTGTFVRPVRGQ
jgi:hypothetical protein